MIRIERDNVIQPGVTDPDSDKYNRELTKALAAYQAWLDGGKNKLPKLKYDIYGDADIRKQLALLFHGKCAYCESIYASTAPMDVEHWRPKKAVDPILGSRKRKDQIVGYYWLAADWENLLPSCIDCNRERNQVIDGDGNLTKGGKQNYFPVNNNDGHFSARKNAHRQWASQRHEEVPLLVNPCDENPEDFFRYTDGLVFPKEGLSELGERKAKTSIRVYGLNRTELVRQRMEWKLLIDARLFSISRLIELIAKLEARPGTEAATDLAKSILEHERKELEALRSPKKPFTAMSRQLIAEGLAKITSE